MKAASLRIKTLAEFVAAVERIHTSWNKRHRDSQFDPWFRGQTDSSWSLIATLYRDKATRKKEHDLLEDFKQRGYPYLVGSTREPSSDWEWYFLMQHYGLPTRLLDWTESALAALYFAVRETPTTFKDASKPPDPCVWATGVVVTRAEMRGLALHPHTFHGDWNYELRPRPS